MIVLRFGSFVVVVVVFAELIAKVTKYLSRPVSQFSMLLTDKALFY